MLRKRNQKIVKKKKAATLESTGCLACEVCGFDSYKVYGEPGQDFCEVHHLKPLSKADGVIETTLDDLAIVCSNCHRVIHRTDPMLTIEELSAIVNACEGA